MADIAYVAVVVPDGNYRLGIAKRDEPGYYRIGARADLGGSFESYDAASAAADVLNERLGLSRVDALEIVLSSMRAQNLAGRGR